MVPGWVFPSMSTLSRLFLLFVGVPLLELFILIKVGQMVGLLPTVALVVVTGVAGGILARLEGVRTLWKIRSELAHGRLPGGALFDGLGILIGGALLLTPGILTDVVGFSFLLPPTRKRLLSRIRASLNRRLDSGAIRITHFGGFPGGGAPVWTESNPWGKPGQGPLDPSGQGMSEQPIPDPSGEIVIEPDDPSKD